MNTVSTERKESDVELVMPEKKPAEVWAACPRCRTHQREANLLPGGKGCCVCG